MKNSQMYRYYRRCADIVRYEGLHILLLRVLRKALSPLGDLNAMTFCLKDLTQPLEEMQAKVDLFVRQATEADIDQVVALMEMRSNPKQKLRVFKTKSIQETINERFQQGDKCFLGIIGTEMVHINWISFHRIEDEHYFVDLRDREAFCNNAFTVLEWRGKAIHGAVHNQMLLFLQQSGFHTAYTTVASYNISSQKALQRLGWNFYSTLLYFNPHKSDKVLTWQIHDPIDPFVLVV